MRMRGTNIGAVIVALLSVVSTAVADTTTGLTAYWKFNEASGSVAHDSIGPYNATLGYTATFVNDPTRGQVLSPNGTGAVVVGPSPISVDAGTIVGWVNETSIDGYNFFLNDVDITVPSEPRIYMYSVNGQYRVGLGTNSSWITSAYFDTGNWHQVALSWQASTPGSGTGEFTAYFDGAPVQGTTYAGLTSIGTDLSLGNQYYPPASAYGSPLQGEMSEFAIWNRALSDSDIATLFNAGHILTPAVPGDINGDGLVDLTDYGLLKGSFFQTVPAGTGADLNGDGKVDLTDFVYFKHDYEAFNGASSASSLAAPVPEPATFVLAVAMLPTWLLVRRSKRSGC